MDTKVINHDELKVVQEKASIATSNAISVLTMLGRTDIAEPLVEAGSALLTQAKTLQAHFGNYESSLQVRQADLVAIREWHEDCEYSVLKRGDKDYIQAANYAPEYVNAVNLLLNLISPINGKCTVCGSIRYVLPGQHWGSCSDQKCPAYKEDKASASYLDSQEREVPNA